jgi:D-beta-D-heptose 7-phosphate kinase / D-beta-D-heptose 1-phosphate adenosyltransferase
MITFESSNSPQILVVGDLMIDQYLWGSCDRISPEAPVQVINVSKDNKLLGGAGNVVNNLKKLGAHVDIFSVIGDCKNSSEILNLFSDIGVSTKHLIRQKNRILSKKTRIIASQQQVVRYDRESRENIDSKTEEQLIKNLANAIDNYEIILLSDYGKGVLTNKVTRSLIDLANDRNIKVIVDPKGNDYLKYKGAFLLTPNKKEATEITKIDIKDNKTLLDAAKKIKTELKLNISLITMSEQGIAIFDNELRVKPTVTREVFDVTGAGDTVLSSLGYALALNTKIDDAVEFANLAAGVVVSKIGSATATIDEIIEHESSLNKSSSDKHIKSFDEILKICNEYKIKNRKVVFTNGCFDVIHLGHIKYLESAKSLGDILILGLNSDKSVTSLKGENRPINNQDERAYILAAMEVVDFVVIFEEDTPYNLINLIKPNILVKGSDYEGKDVIGSDLVDELVLVEFIKGRSSTNIIDKIKKS